ncbi:MAG: GNAT family N-acetyltransferase [Oscillospiraceae bacterium]|nr:GNAT family N-acetyltransferase [Oscillospiraceae bacterium]
MSLTIRLARAEDYPAIARMLRQISALHHGWRPDLFPPTGVKMSAEQFHTALETPDTPILVAQLDGAAAGYAMCQLRRVRDIPVLRERDFLLIDDLCVDETCRRQGVGEALMQAAVDFARQHGLDAIELNVMQCNEAARRFYEQLGLTVKSRIMEMKL